MSPRSDRVRLEIDVEPGSLMAVEQWGVAYDDGTVITWLTKEQAYEAAEHTAFDDPGYVVQRLITVTATVWSKP